MGPPILCGKDLGKSYTWGKRSISVFNNLGINLNRGEIVVLLGPSGVGKSSLLHVLSGLEIPDKGVVLYDGQDLHKMSDRRLSGLRARNFGFVFQAYNLIGGMTALENVEVPSRIAGQEKAMAKAKEALEHVGLGDRMNHHPWQLSGGEQQRVAVARALVCHPQIIFADEPTGNLDAQTGAEIVTLLTSRVREEGAACVLVTHNPEWIAVADRVLQLRDGNLCEVS
ncbi:MAG: putative ABC transport system ATP-binding protein [Bacillota bacterium]|nr:MAG: putative ABC transport system ATP-binding protein [Bacillota bacterium]